METRGAPPVRAEPVEARRKSPFDKLRVTGMILWGILIAVMAGVVAGSIGDSPQWEGVGDSPRRDTLQSRVSRRGLSPTFTPRGLSPYPGEPVFAKAPAFQLIDQEGRSFSSDNLKSKVWVADFIFTSCAGACPQMTRKMALLRSKISKDIPFVSISVDPARDTPEVLARYAKEFKADLSRWHFLTGDPEGIEALVKRFRLSYAEGGAVDEPITHSQRFVLVDNSGMIRGYYDSVDVKALEQLEADAFTLLNFSRQ